FLLISAGNLASLIPVTDICYLGFAFRDADEGVRIMSGPLGGYLSQEIVAKNIYPLRTIWDSGMSQIGGLRPIRTPADLAGFKIRVPESRITIDLFKGLGATPTPISQSEVYTSLQTKLIDGQQSPLVSLETAKFYEVEKYVSLTNHGFSGTW